MKVLCVLIGYLCGCILTAEIVTRLRTGESARKFGSGNPGMANMGRIFGVRWAAVTLLGDILKTVLACMLCRHVLFPEMGRTAILYAGVGAALGHGFPFWNGFRGGRGVAVTCAYLFLFSPSWGIFVELVGLCVTLWTGYLAVGALVIPSLYLAPVFWAYGLESGLVILAGTALLYLLHRDSLRNIAKKTENKTDLLSGFGGHRKVGEEQGGRIWRPVRSCFPARNRQKKL